MCETVLDVLRNHPNFDPKTQTDIPSMEEIYAANTMTYEQARHLQQLDEARCMAERAREYGDSQEHAANEIRLRMRRANVPERFVGVAADMTRLPDMGAYIFGRQGSGKTTLACSMLKGWMIENRGQAFFVTSSDLMDELHATYSTSETERGVVMRYGTCRLLVIDDLGKETPTDQTLTKLWQVIDRRYGSMLPTIVTTQYDPAGLARELSRRGGTETAKAIVSRLYETCLPVTTGNVDHRKKSQNSSGT